MQALLGAEPGSCVQDKFMCAYEVFYTLIIFQALKCVQCPPYIFLFYGVRPCLRIDIQSNYLVGNVPRRGGQRGRVVNKLFVHVFRFG